MVKSKLSIVFLAAVMTACQVIPEDQRLIEQPMVVPADAHPHVLVDFTGFKCVNCPTAAEQAATLKTTYGTQLIVVAMHPASNPFTQGAAQYDYTCPEADVYYQWMGGTASTPFPTGNVDFLPVDNSYLIDYLSWPARVAERMNDTTDVRLLPEATLDTVTRTITIRTAFYAGTPTTGQLVYWLVEDSVVGAQRMPDGSTKMDYVHHHMLRAAAGEVWGKKCSPASYVAHDTTLMQLPETCRAAQCTIVALMLDPDDRHIINANETNIQIQ